ncbi:hypothetical protein NDU88_008383, partial [Pleurodeles waltl]
ACDQRQLLVMCAVAQPCAAPARAAVTAPVPATRGSSWSCVLEHSPMCSTSQSCSDGPTAWDQGQLLV